ncbi:MAG: ribonuclease J [Candidatus Gracilibacteria bacterium]|jgi:ribonuclease J|nr:ribonuclease J [Candidatus Gracilibacteria bacterium]
MELKRFFKKSFLNQKTLKNEPENKVQADLKVQNKSFKHFRKGSNFGGKKPLKSAPKPVSQTKPKVHPIVKGSLKIIPLGGLNEVGKNMMVLEYEEDIIVVDMGFQFPNEDMLGIDYVIPDVTYLEENRHRIRGIFITHGHLDHIGAVPYILPKLNYPTIFTTKFTAELIDKKLEEFKLKNFSKLVTVSSDDHIKAGKFSVDFFRVAHSIPDAVGLVITTPAGKVVHTGDFKFDDTPAGLHEKAEINKMKRLGNENVLALFSDSTNALKPGKTMSEEEVGHILEGIIQKTEKRLIVASFSSLIGRIQQLIDLAQKHNRKVFISGRSMEQAITIAKKLGYIKYEKGAVLPIKKHKNTPDEQTLILTTGSQGESVSALSRIARNEHKQIKVKKGDTIILSSSPIIGNERAIATVINRLCLLGAKVIHKQIMDVHTSGHGQREDLKTMINYIKPKFFIPVHGEFFMRQAHADLAKEECGIPEQNIFMLQNGNILYMNKTQANIAKAVIETKYILIDGSGEGHAGSQVQAERQMMSENGALIVLLYVSKLSKRLKGKPEVMSRGFVYMHETEEIYQEIIELADDAFRKLIKKNPGATRQDMKNYLSRAIDTYTYNKLERRPLIVPIIIEK